MVMLWRFAVKVNHVSKIDPFLLANVCHGFVDFEVLVLISFTAMN